MRPTRSLALVVMIGLGLAGCGKHYWYKPGGASADFARDSGECARENALYMSANKDYGIVRTELYKACLKSRGWLRAQSHEPPADWFRGIESDDPVRLDPTPPQPPVTPRSGLPSDNLVGTWAGQLTRPSFTGQRRYPAVLRIVEQNNALRGSLEVSGIDLKGSGEVVRSETAVSLSGRFGQRSLPISFTLAVNGSALDANGLGADNMLYRLALQKR